jgi:hypothetical protein
VTRIRGWGRRAVLAGIVTAQLTLIVGGYHDPHHVFAFQMFPGASDWQAVVYRVLPDGKRVDIRDGWPGGYAWRDLVDTKGLGDAFNRHHATDGLDATLDFLRAALDWVALHTPADREAVRLEADVTYWDNGRGPFEVTLTSATR